MSSDPRGMFHNHMRHYILQHFGDLLGEHKAVLDQDDGFDRLAELMREGKIGTPD